MDPRVEVYVERMSEEMSKKILINLLDYFVEVEEVAIDSDGIPYWPATGEPLDKPF